MSAPRPAPLDGAARLAESPAGVAALLLAASAAIHLKAAADHGPHWWAYGAFFAVLAALQAGCCVQLARGGVQPRPIALAVAASLGAAGLWGWSRTAGIPVGPWAWEPEPIGVADAVATGVELCTAALLAAVLRPTSRLARRLTWVQGAQATRLASMLVVTSLLALALGGHSHA